MGTKTFHSANMAAVIVLITEGIAPAQATTAAVPLVLPQPAHSVLGTTRHLVKGKSNCKTIKICDEWKPMFKNFYNNTYCAREHTETVCGADTSATTAPPKKLKKIKTPQM